MSNKRYPQAFKVELAKQVLEQSQPDRDVAELEVRIDVMIHRFLHRS